MSEANKRFEQVAETDGAFFDDMRRIEREALHELGDTEALEMLDAEEAAAQAEEGEDEE